MTRWSFGGGTFLWLLAMIVTWANGPGLHAGDGGQAATSQVASRPADSAYGQWRVIPADRLPLAPSTQADILAAVRKYAAGIKSWDVKYRVIGEQFPRTIQQGQGKTIDVPDARVEARVHEIVSADGIFLDQAVKQSLDRGAVHHYRTASDGRLTYWLDADSRSGSVSDYTTVATNGCHTYGDCIATGVRRLTSNESPFAGGMPDLLKSLDDPDLKLVAERTEVNGHACYLFESRTTSRAHTFKNTEEAVAWHKEHPNDRGALVVNVGGRPSKREDIHLVRIAVDPQADFMPVRLVTAAQIIDPQSNFETPLMPLAELHVVKVGRTRNGIIVPMEATFVRYDNSDIKTVIGSRARLEVDEVSLNEPPGPGIFKIEFPHGIGVLDRIRGISYKVGDSEETIQRLLAAAAKEKAFYDGLLGKAPPPLQAAQWLIGDPIRLADIKDRPIIVHFWNIGCGPCVAKIPRLQDQHGATLKDKSGPLFVSVHASCDAKTIPEVRAFLKAKGVTFPVMLDAAETKEESWGITHKAYGIQYVPQDAKIDEKGRLVSVGMHELAR